MKGRKRDPFMQKDMKCAKCKNPVYRICYSSYNEDNQPTYVRTAFWFCPKCEEFFRTEITPLVNIKEQM